MMNNLSITVQNFIRNFWKLMELLSNFSYWKSACITYVLLPVHTLCQNDVIVNKHCHTFNSVKILIQPLRHVKASEARTLTAEIPNKTWTSSDLIYNTQKINQRLSGDEARQRDKVYMVSTRENNESVQKLVLSKKASCIQIDQWMKSLQKPTYSVDCVNRDLKL